MFIYCFTNVYIFFFRFKKQNYLWKNQKQGNLQLTSLTNLFFIKNRGNDYLNKLLNEKKKKIIKFLLGKT